MYFRMDHPPVKFDDYKPLIPAEMADELTTIASELRGMTVAHLNSTATGGGVAEILQSMVPLMNSLGIETERIVIDPPSQFFGVTKQIHNMLQGAPGALSQEEWDTYQGAIRDVANALHRDDLRQDVWFVHDPQVLPLANFLRCNSGSTWVWIGHIDLTSPNPGLMDSLLPYFSDYDRLVFSLDDYVPGAVRGVEPVVIAPPGIDPLSEKNLALAEAEARDIVAAAGIDSARPLVTQVSRFDAWKDPWGVIDAYRQAREAVPGLQLAMLGIIQATDDPEAFEMVHNVTEYADGDPDIHLYSRADGLPCSVDKLVNAFQTASRVVVQKSTREGFGLTVTEAMWKGKAMIGGNVGGIKLQIQDGESGFLVDSPEQCGVRIVQLFEDPELNARLGDAARESVRNNYLLPRLTLDYLRAARASQAEKAGSPNAQPDTSRGGFRV